MNRIIKNFAYQSMYQVLSIILPIVTVPIVNKSLGVNGVGLFNYVTSITNYFVLIAGLGLAQYGIREVAIVRKDKTSLSQKFWELQFFNLVISGLTFILYLVFSFFTNYPLFFIINGALILGALFDISWFFAGIEDFKKITIRNSVIKIFSFFAIVFLIRKPSNLTLYFIIQAGSTLVSQVSFWFVLRGKVKFLVPKYKDIFSHFKPAISFFFSKLSSTIINNSTKTILGLIVSSAAVGIFSNGTLLIWVASTLVSSLNTVLLPQMSKIAYSDRTRLSIVLNKSISIQIILTLPIACGIVAVTPKMINWFYGLEFAEIVNIIPILAIGLILQQVQQAIAVGYNIPMHRMKEYNRGWVFACILMIVLSIVLIPNFGVIGAALANTATTAFLAIVRISDMNKDIKFKLDTKPIFASLISSIVMFISIRILTANFAPTIITTVFQIVFGIVIYTICSILLGQQNYVKSIIGKRNF